MMTNQLELVWVNPRSEEELACMHRHPSFKHHYPNILHVIRSEDRFDVHNNNQLP